ncbi:hypothetical protein Y695_04175 [Hydrogenophaga sp. T4]|nr:hypothetical protein Y695_04175 [Hydrogenophaga sp. T4]
MKLMLLYRRRWLLIYLPSCWRWQACWPWSPASGNRCRRSGW